MSAIPLIFLKRLFSDGAILEIKIWQLPRTTQERPHGLKYSLFYGRHGTRIIGYDNERGKGDHRHYGDRQERYEFTSLEQLITDFEQDVALARAKPEGEVK